MKKKICFFIVLAILIIQQVSAQQLFVTPLSEQDSIAVSKSLKKSSGLIVYDCNLSTTDDLGYLSVYENTQVTDIVFPNVDSERFTMAMSEVGKFGIEVWCSFEIENADSISQITLDNIPKGVNGIELDFVGGNYIDLIADGGVDEFREKITADLQALKSNIDNIKIAVKVPAIHTIAYDNGLDVYTWISDDLVDLYFISPYNSQTETNLELEVWNEIIGENGMVVGVIGTYMNTPKTKDRILTLENAAALANAYYSSGAFKFYIDYFKCETSEEIYVPNTEISVYKSSIADLLLTKCGDLETLAKVNKRFIVANSVMKGNHSLSQNYNPLPLTNNGSGYNSLKINTGKISSDSDVKLFVGIKRTDDVEIQPANIKIFVNKVKPIFAEKISSELSDCDVLVYNLNNDYINDGGQIFEISSNVYVNSEKIPIVVDYLEIREMIDSD